MYLKVFLLFIFINLTSISIDNAWKVPSKYQIYKYEDFFKTIENIDKKIDKKTKEVNELLKNNISPMYWSYEQKSLYLKLIQEITNLENESNTLISKYNAIQFITNE
ncbi:MULTISPECIES: hypothetical protein [Bacteria]|uniref:hypothetical protein n=1 Tax=Bacteria TaxID=2 RepID=UPI003F40CA4C